MYLRMALRTHFFNRKDTTIFANLVKNMILVPGCLGLWVVFIV